MQTFDDLDILAISWMAMMFAVFICAALLSSLFSPKPPRRLPPPQFRATCNHCRWYRVTTSRLNDHRPNGGTRGDF